MVLVADDIGGLADVAISGSYNDLINQPDIPSKTSDLTNDSGFITSYTETDPVVGAVNGIVKADGAGVISAAVPNVDYLLTETSHDDVVVDGDFITEGLMKRTGSSGVYTIVPDKSDDWNAAASWGNHADQNYLTSLPAHGLIDHTDVSYTDPKAGEVLKYDGSQWTTGDAVSVPPTIVYKGNINCEEVPPTSATGDAYIQSSVNSPVTPESTWGIADSVSNGAYLIRGESQWFLSNNITDVDLSDYAKLTDLPEVNDSLIILEDNASNELGRFTLNQDQPSTIQLPTGVGGGIPDAPNDGLMYGRKTLTWQRSVDASGDTMTGDLVVQGTDPTYEFPTKIAHRKINTYELVAGEYTPLVEENGAQIQPGQFSWKFSQTAGLYVKISPHLTPTSGISIWNVMDAIDPEFGPQTEVHRIRANGAGFFKGGLRTGGNMPATATFSAGDDGQVSMRHFLNIEAAGGSANTLQFKATEGLFIGNSASTGQPDLQIANNAEILISGDAKFKNTVCHKIAVVDGVDERFTMDHNGKLTIKPTSQGALNIHNTATDSNTVSIKKNGKAIFQNEVTCTDIKLNNFSSGDSSVVSRIEALESSLRTLKSHALTASNLEELKTAIFNALLSY